MRLLSNSPSGGAISRDFLEKIKLDDGLFFREIFLDYVTLFVLGKLLSWLFLLVSNESYLRQNGTMGQKGYKKVSFYSLIMVLV